jgi:hypothetical protein
LHRQNSYISELAIISNSVPTSLAPSIFNQTLSL